MKLTGILLCFLLALGLVAARAPYQFSDGYLDILGAEPTATFTCENRPYGYYADAANECRVFHICLPIVDELGEVLETHQFSFFCGNQTVFSQDTLSCSHEVDALPCEESADFYEVSNADFGKIPDDAIEK